MTPTAGFIRVGLIANTHGVRGELLVKPLTDDPKRFERLERVFISGMDHSVSDSYEIEYVRFHKNKLLLKFRRLDDINAVLNLKGSYIAIDQNELVELPEDSYFIFDLLGCKVYNTSSVLLGTVTDVLETGSNDVYVVVPDNDAKEMLIPAIKSVIKKVSIAEKTIISDFTPESG
jgi:16S rRNA processing protein RimM